MVAGTIGDYAAFVVGKDSPINSMEDLVAAYKAEPRKTAIGGGSVTSATYRSGFGLGLPFRPPIITR